MPLNITALKTTLFAVLPLGLLVGSAAPAAARTIRMDVFTTNDGTGTCPQTLTAYETFNYFEGGGSTDGMVQLAAAATNIRPDATDEFSATWVGDLKPEFSDCVGSAGMSLSDGEPHEGPSYIRVQFIGGQARVILDMTGIGGPNDTMPVIIDQTMREGNPRWTWAVAD